MVAWFIWESILAHYIHCTNYVIIMIRHHKDPYEPTSTTECHKGFEVEQGSFQRRACKCVATSSTAKADDKCLICDSEIACSFLAIGARRKAFGWMWAFCQGHNQNCWIYSNIFSHVQTKHTQNVSQTYSNWTYSQQTETVANARHYSRHEARFQTPDQKKNVEVTHGTWYAVCRTLFTAGAIRGVSMAVLAEHFAAINFIKKLTARADMHPVTSGFHTSWSSWSSLFGYPPKLRWQRLRSDHDIPKPSMDVAGWGDLFLKMWWSFLV